MKISYYMRLALSDIKNRRGIYLPYALLSALFLSFLYVIVYIALHSDYTRLSVGSNLTPEVMKIGIVVMVLLVAILLWTFSLTIRRHNTRQQGLYRILGLTRKNLLLLNAVETLLVSIISLLFGMLLCIVFGKLLLMTAERFSQQYLADAIHIDGRLLLLLCGYLLLIQLCIVVRDSIHIFTYNPLRMLRQEKTQERPKASKLEGIMGIVLLLAAYVIAFYISNIADDIQWILAAIILVIIGTYFLFNGAAILILETLQKRERIFYHKNRMLTISNLLFRMRTYATSMASICVLLTMLILTSSMCLSLYTGTEDNVKKDFMDYEFKFNGLNSEKDLDKLMQKHHLSIQDQARVPIVHTGIQVIVRDQQLWIGKVNDTRKDTDAIPTLNAFTVSGYNAATKSNLTLKKDEVLLYNATGINIEEVHCRMKLEDGSTELKEFAVRKVDKTLDIFSRNLTLIVPDEQASDFVNYLHGEYASHGQNEDLDGVSMYRLINFEGSTADKKAFSEELRTIESIDCQDYYSVLAWALSLYGSFLFLGILFSIIFIFAIFMILYYRMHDDLRDHERQYEILYRMGLTRKELCKEFARENRWLLLSPPIMAIVHSLVAYPAFHILSSLFGFGEEGFSFPLLVEGCAMVLIIFILYHGILQSLVNRKIMARNYE